MTTAERKRGKHERIRLLLNNIRAEQNRFDDNIMLAEAKDAPGAEDRSIGRETAFAGHPLTSSACVP